MATLLPRVASHGLDSDLSAFMDRSIGSGISAAEALNRSRLCGNASTNAGSNMITTSFGQRSLSASDLKEQKAHLCTGSSATVGNVRRRAKLKKTASTNDVSILFSPSEGARSVQSEPDQEGSTEFSIMYSVISEAAAMVQNTDMVICEKLTQASKTNDSRDDEVSRVDTFNGTVGEFRRKSVEESSTICEPTGTRCHTLAEAIDAEDWPTVVQMCDNNPSAVRQETRLLDRCEKSFGTFLHSVCMRRPPLAVVVALIKANPSSLFIAESKRARLAIHVAAEHGASTDVVSFLVKSHPGSVTVRDADNNLPLHYAASFGTDEVLASLIDADGGSGCRFANNRQKFPLHLVCARSGSIPSIKTTQAILDNYKDAAKKKDGAGRLPLHTASNMLNPRDDVLDLLLHTFPESINVKDSRNATAFDLAMTFAARNRGRKKEALKKLKSYQKTQQRVGILRFMSMIVKRHKENLGHDKEANGKKRVLYKRSVSPVTTKRRHFIMP